VNGFSSTSDICDIYSKSSILERHITPKCDEYARYGLTEKENLVLTRTAHVHSSRPPPRLRAQIHCKKVIDFTVPSRVGWYLPNSLWPGIILLFSAKESSVSDIPAGDGKIINLFYSVATPRPSQLSEHREPPPAPLKLCPVWPARPTHIKRRVRAGSSHCWRLQRQRNNHHECKCSRVEASIFQFYTSIGISKGFKWRMIATGKIIGFYFLQNV
jgi:hypothetical protein